MAVHCVSSQSSVKSEITQQKHRLCPWCWNPDAETAHGADIITHVYTDILTDLFYCVDFNAQPDQIQHHGQRQSTPPHTDCNLGPYLHHKHRPQSQTCSKMVTQTDINTRVTSRRTSGVKSCDRQVLTWTGRVDLVLLGCSILLTDLVTVVEGLDDHRQYRHTGLLLWW